MSQTTALQQLDAALHAAFMSAGFAFAGAPYTPKGRATETRDGCVDRDVQVLGEFGQVIERRDEITILKASGRAELGATLIVDGSTYVLAGKIHEDESIVRFTPRSRSAAP